MSYKKKKTRLEKDLNTSCTSGNKLLNITVTSENTTQVDAVKVPGAMVIPEHRNVKSKVFARHLQRGSGDESEKGADQNTEPCVLQPMPESSESICPPQHDVNHPQHDVNPPQHEVNPPQHDVNPPQHEVNPPQHEVNPPQHDVNPPQRDDVNTSQQNICTPSDYMINGSNPINAQHLSVPSMLVYPQIYFNKYEQKTSAVLANM
ncbi:hypothetical protein EMCRGX_G012232 [Ephydatia muelleri]